MRYLPIFCLGIMFNISYQLTAQTGFVFAPEFFEEIYVNEEIEKFYILKGEMGNTSNQILEVDWKVVDLDLPDDWIKQVVDKNIEYVPHVNNSFNPVTLAVEELDAPFKILLYPEGQSGCGTFKVVFNEHHSGAAIDTVEYLISINDESCLITNIQAVELEGIKIYPNPVSDKVYIESSEKFSQYKIYSNLGQVLLQGEATNQLDVSQLLKGDYYLQLITDDLSFYTFKFINL